MPNGDTDQRQMLPQIENSIEEYVEEGATSDPVMTKSGMKERKKGLMTRLIPGRNAPLGIFYKFMIRL